MADALKTFTALALAKSEAATCRAAGREIAKHADQRVKRMRKALADLVEFNWEGVTPPNRSAGLKLGRRLDAARDVLHLDISEFG